MTRSAWTMLTTAVCAFSVLLAGALAPGCREDPDKLVFGFVLAEDECWVEGAAAPLADGLSAELGITVEPFAFGSSAELLQGLRAGQIDIALLNPFAYVAARETGSVRVLLRCVRDGRDWSRSEIIALAEGGPRTLEEVRGKAFAFVDPSSPSGYLFPVAHLLRSGLDPERDLGEVVFTGSQEEVVRAVLEGRVAAGACREGARRSVYAEARDVFERVAVIAYTLPVPNRSVVVRAALRPDLVERIKQALLAVTAGGKGREAWKVVSGGYDGFVEAEDQDYDVIRETAEILELDIEILAGCGDRPDGRGGP